MKSAVRRFVHLFVIMALCAGSARAQSGSVMTGTIKDVITGSILPGASVFIKGTRKGAVSDQSGKYVITKLPSGKHTIVATYLGYERFEQEIELRAGETLTQDIGLTSSFLELDGVVVEGLREGQARALNQQKTAPNIKNIVAADAIGRFPDLNTAEALQRIPSLSIQRDQGEGRYVLIRGTEARLNSVTINGDRIPSPEGDVRHVALDVIPSDVLSSIEVNKAITPDMDGDAIGGSINLVTKSAFDYDRPMYKLTLASGYNDIVGDPNYQAAGTYGNRFGKDKQLGILVSASYFRTDRGSDNNEMEWITRGDLDDFPDDFGITVPQGVNVIGDLQLRDYVITRERLGFSSTIDYQLGSNSSIYLRGLYNRFTDDEQRRRGRVRFDEGEYTSVNQTSGTIADGAFERELKDRFEAQTIFNVAGGGSHLLSGMTLDYNVSFSRSEEDEPDRHDINFILEDVALTYDISNPDIPQFAGENFLDASMYEFDELVIENNLTTDQDLSAGANLSIPYELGDNLGDLKFGVKYRAKEKERVNRIDIYDGLIDGKELTLDQIAGDFEDDEFLDNSYQIGRAADADRVDDLVNNNIGIFTLDADGSREDTDAGNYSATENIIAGYVMTTVNFGNLMVLPGARFESTTLEYTGNVLTFDEEGELLPTTSVTEESDYTNILPMLHARYRFNSSTNIRAAWTNSIARPNYFDLAPFRLVNREDQEVERGNPTLEPTTSMNFDLFAEHYMESLGLLSVGVFYKDLQDIIFKQTLLGTGEFDGFMVTTPINGESATLLGVEVTWQQQLTFLPGFFNGFGVYANYTFTDSEAELVGRTDTPTLPGQSEHIANAALSYEKHGFSGRIALNFHGSYINEIGANPDEDIFYDDHVQVDFSASYKVRKGVRVFVELLNITDEPLRFFMGDESRPIQREFYSFWGHAGVKLDL